MLAKLCSAMPESPSHPIEQFAATSAWGGPSYQPVEKTIGQLKRSGSMLTATAAV